MILHSVDYGEYCKVLEDVIFIKNLFIYLFLALLGFHCCTDFSLVSTSRGYSLVAEQGLQ